MDCLINNSGGVKHFLIIFHTKSSSSLDTNFFSHKTSQILKANTIYSDSNVLCVAIVFYLEHQSMYPPAQTIKFSLTDLREGYFRPQFKFGNVFRNSCLALFRKITLNALVLLHGVKWVLLFQICSVGRCIMHVLSKVVY